MQEMKPSYCYCCCDMSATAVNHDTVMWPQTTNSRSKKTLHVFSSAADDTGICLFNTRQLPPQRSRLLTRNSDNYRYYRLQEDVEDVYKPALSVAVSVFVVKGIKAGKTRWNGTHRFPRWAPLSRTASLSLEFRDMFILLISNTLFIISSSCFFWAFKSGHH